MAKNISNLDKSLKQNITPADIGAAASNHGTHLTLGTGSGNAYRGDYGNTAYNHSQAAHAPSNAQKNSDITKSEIEAKLTGNITSHSHSTYATTSTTGSLSNLQTSAKGNLVAAINELFQNVDSGKQLIADAIGDDNITKDSTFQAMSNAISSGGCKYKYNLKIFMQTSQPTALNYGDIWIPVSATDYKLNFVKNASEISSPTGKDIHLKVANSYLQLNLDESFNSFLKGFTTSFNINLITQSFQQGQGNCNIPLLANAVSYVFVKLGFAKLYNASTGIWEKINAKFWNGSMWMGFTNEKVIVYGVTMISSKIYIFALDLESQNIIWKYAANSVCSAPYISSKLEIIEGNETLLVQMEDNKTTGSAYLCFFNKNTGELKKKIKQAKYDSNYDSYSVYCKDNTFINVYSNSYSYDYNLYRYDENGNEIASFYYANDGINPDARALALFDDCIGVIGYDWSEMILHSFDFTTVKEIYSSVSIPTYGNTYTKSGKLTSFVVSTRTFTQKIMDVNFANGTATISNGVKFTLPSSFTTSAMGYPSIFIHRETGEEMFVYLRSATSSSSASQLAVFDNAGTLVYSAATSSTSFYDGVVYEGGLLIGTNHSEYGTLYRFDLQDYTIETLSTISNVTTRIFGLATSSGIIGKNNENYGI